LKLGRRKKRWGGVGGGGVWEKEEKMEKTREKLKF